MNDVLDLDEGENILQEDRTILGAMAPRTSTPDSSKAKKQKPTAFNFDWCERGQGEIVRETATHPGVTDNGSSTTPKQSATPGKNGSSPEKVAEIFPGENSPGNHSKIGSLSDKDNQHAEKVAEISPLENSQENEFMDPKIDGLSEEGDRNNEKIAEIYPPENSPGSGFVDPQFGSLSEKDEKLACAEGETSYFQSLSDSLFESQLQTDKRLHNLKTAYKKQSAQAHLRHSKSLDDFGCLSSRVNNQQRELDAEKQNSAELEVKLCVQQKRISALEEVVNTWQRKFQTEREFNRSLQKMLNVQGRAIQSLQDKVMSLQSRVTPE